MDLPFSFPAFHRMSVRPPTPHPHSRGLGRALAASLLLHLILVGDLIRPDWRLPDSSTNLHHPLSVELASRGSSFPAAAARPFPPAQPRSRREPEPAFEQPLPLVENVVSIDVGRTQQDQNPDPPVANRAPEAAQAAQGAEVAEEQSTGATLQRLPSSGKIEYRFYWGKARWLAGLATHQWVVDGGNYTLSSTVSTTGLFGLIQPVRLVETSQGSVVGDRLRPQMFITQLNDNPPAISYFNWSKGYFRWYRGTASFTQTLPASAYDKISFLYQLYLTPLKENSYATAIATGRQLERYEIRNLGVEEVDIDGLAYPAHHLKRITASADAEQVEIWLSIRDSLPIKMVYSNSAGDHFEQLIAAESIPAGSRE